MSTDTVIVVKEIADNLRSLIQAVSDRRKEVTFKLISTQSKQRVEKLIQNATLNGATISNGQGNDGSSTADQALPMIIVEDLNTNMDLFFTESFGPVLGLKVVDTASQAIEIAKLSEYGLSAAIWTKNHHLALTLARQLNVGAVHVNGMTVHDEATLPHGGRGDSGYGRFGGAWGLQEFLQTQTVVLNP